MFERRERLGVKDEWDLVRTLDAYSGYTSDDWVSDFCKETADTLRALLTTCVAYGDVLPYWLERTHEAERRASRYRQLLEKYRVTAALHPDIRDRDRMLRELYMEIERVLLEDQKCSD